MSSFSNAPIKANSYNYFQEFPDAFHITHNYLLFIVRDVIGDMAPSCVWPQLVVYLILVF